MHSQYIKRVIWLGLASLLSSCVFAWTTSQIFNPISRASIFLQDMTSSYTFLDDVYAFNIPALKGRLENWVNHIHSITEQPICLSARFTSFQDSPETSVTVCSQDTKLSDIARKADVSGIVPIQLGEKDFGEIEWLSKSVLNVRNFVYLFISYLAISSFLIFIITVIFKFKKVNQMTSDSHQNTDILRSLYRIMSSNRRTMAFHDNWIYGERAHPYVNFINLDGSKLRLRTSLSDVVTIFPHARHISRSSLVNTSIGVHRIQEGKIILKTKSGELTFDIESAYLETIKS